jgi:hypothetical protein
MKGLIESIDKLICEEAFNIPIMDGIKLTSQKTIYFKKYSSSKKEWPTADDFERAVIRCGFKFKPKEKKFHITNGKMTLIYN